MNLISSEGRGAVPERNSQNRMYFADFMISIRPVARSQPREGTLAEYFLSCAGVQMSAPEHRVRQADLGKAPNYTRPLPRPTELESTSGAQCA